jgi:hypothetical protein
LPAYYEKKELLFCKKEAKNFFLFRVGGGRARYRPVFVALMVINGYAELANSYGIDQSPAGLIEHYFICSIYFSRLVSSLLSALPLQCSRTAPKGMSLVSNPNLHSLLMPPRALMLPAMRCWQMPAISRSP